MAIELRYRKQLERNANVQPVLTSISRILFGLNCSFETKVIVFIGNTCNVFTLPVMKSSNGYATVRRVITSQN
jgi:hypothetical protein